MGDDVNDIPLLRKVGLSGGPGRRLPGGAVRGALRLPVPRRTRRGAGAVRAHPDGAGTAPGRERHPLGEADAPHRSASGPSAPGSGSAALLPVPAGLGARAASSGAVGLVGRAPRPGTGARAPGLAFPELSEAGAARHRPGHLPALRPRRGRGRPDRPHRSATSSATSPTLGDGEALLRAAHARPARGSSSSPATWGAGSCWPGASSGLGDPGRWSSRPAAGTGASTTWSRASALERRGAHPLPRGRRRAAGHSSGPCGTGKALGILIDQDTKVQSVFVPFFGHLASTPRAAADLALRFGCPVSWAGPAAAGPKAGRRLRPRGRARSRTTPTPADKEAEVLRITATCTARSSRPSGEAPAEWVWMHRRWKTKPPESR